jgi:hypothetical protein
MCVVVEPVDEAQWIKKNHQVMQRWTHQRCPAVQVDRGFDHVIGAFMMKFHCKTFKSHADLYNTRPRRCPHRFVGVMITAGFMTQLAMA